jgi:hypothetical protein
VVDGLRRLAHVAGEEEEGGSREWTDSVREVPSTTCWKLLCSLEEFEWAYRFWNERDAVLRVRGLLRMCIWWSEQVGQRGVVGSGILSYACFAFALVASEVK